PLFGLDARGLVVLGLTPEVVGGGDRFRGLPSQLDDALDHCPAEVCIRGLALAALAIAAGGSALARPPPPWRPRNGFRLAGREGAGVQQPVTAVLGLQSLPRRQSSYGPGNGKGIGESRFPSNVGRRTIKKVARLC